MRLYPLKLSLKVQRSSFYAQGDPSGSKVVPLKRGPKTSLTDAVLLDLIKEDLATSPSRVRGTGRCAHGFAARATGCRESGCFGSCG